MKRNITTFIAGFILFTLSMNLYSQTVPSLFCGQNAWLPDSVGAKPFYGALKNNWTNISNSNVKLIRYGGVACDSFLSYDRQFIKIIDSARNHGIEPIIQVPTTPGLSFDSAMAGGLVKRLNITYGLKVKYWIIGNEPDRYATGKNTARYIHNYIIPYATAMKNRDTSIKIIGPELSWINSHSPTSSNQKIMDSLTTTTFTTSIVGTIGSGHGSGKAFIDYLSWHDYAFDGSVSAKPLKTIERQLTHVDSANYGWMRRRCNTVNASRGSYPLNPVITEANLNYFSGTANPTDNTWNGKKTNSFLAGQFWAQMMAVGLDRGLSWINFWSVIEGSDLCYISSSGTKKPTYQHMLEFGKYYNHTGTSTAGTNYLGTTNDSNLKAFAVYNTNQIAVFILNMDSNKNTQKFYNIRLDGTAQSGTWAKTNMGISGTGTYSDSIYGQSTTVILYDCGGFVSKKYRYELRDSLNPWKSVWAASSPATVLTADLGPDIIACCSVTLTSNPSISGANYEWRYDANSYSTVLQTGSSNTYANAGGHTYKVIVTKGSCTATDFVKITETTPSCCKMAGIDPISQSAVTELLNNVPNPTDGKTTIYYNLADNIAKGDLYITDIFGKIVQKISVKSNNQSIEVDCSQYANGIYFYSLIAEGKKIGTKKMIIAK